MTDLPFSDDELLSSYLDGELTDEEHDRVEDRLGTEPRLAARLDALRSAAALAATPIPALPAADVDRLISAALDAGSNVTDLAAARTSRSTPWRSRLVAVAAAVALVAISVPALRSFDWSSGDVSDTASTEADDSGGSPFDAEELATESADATTASEDEGADAPADGIGGDLDDSAATFADTPQFEAYDALGRQIGGFDPLPDTLGAFADLDAMSEGAHEAWTAERLRDAATTTLVPSTMPAADHAAPSPIENESTRSAAAAYLDGYGGCGSAIDTVTGFAYSAPPVAVDYASATVGGEPVTVALLRLVDGTGVLLVLDTDGCTLRYDEALPGPDAATGGGG